MENTIVKLAEQVDKLVWGPLLLFLLIGTGAWLMLKLKWIPIRRLGWSIGLALGKEQQSKKKERGEAFGVSPFSALATELAATMGTGNIVGVVGAMTLGGPGALVWMVLSGILGMATKLVESTLAVKYRIRKSSGEYLGGPMITLAKAFPERKTGKILAITYAGLAVLGAFGMGNLVQSNSIAVSLEASLGWNRCRTGLVVSVLTILVILGGIRLVSGIAGILVPAMGALYLAGCLGIILTHLDNLIPAMEGILQAAVCPKAVEGGIFGTLTVSWTDSLKWGVSRGVFSNEAGLGASGISAAASETASPVRQGFISMTGVFFDTIVCCVITGIAYACSGVPGILGENGGRILLLNGTQANGEDGAGLMVAAFESSFGKFGGILLGVCITLFAFATILGWEYQGEQAFVYLFGEKRKLFFRFLYGLACLPGAVFALELVWNLSDICNGLLAIPNLICVLVLAPEICREIRLEGNS